jgi:hypothetical protein
MSEEILREPFGGLWFGIFNVEGEEAEPSALYPNKEDAEKEIERRRARPEGEAHVALMRQWRPEWDGQRASTILEAIFRGEKEALEDAARGKPDVMAEVRAAVRALTKCRERDQPSAHAFGMRLRQLRGKIRGGMKIHTEIDKSTRAAIYWMIGPPAAKPV